MSSPGDEKANEVGTATLTNNGDPSTPPTHSTPPAAPAGDHLTISSLKWWTDEEEARVRRKLDWNILPMLFIIYGAAYIDRSNIGNAKTAGMNVDLGISDIQYRLITTIFIISYILFQWLLLFYVS